jgi:hypothetical protein
MIGFIAGRRHAWRSTLSAVLLSSMLVGVASAQDNPCKSEDPANFGEELRSDCGGGEPYMPDHWGSDVTPPDETGGLPMGSGDSGGYSSLADWFRNMNADDRTRFKQWAAAGGFPQANTMSEDEFAALLKLMDGEMEREGIPPAERQKWVRDVAEEFAGSVPGSDDDILAGIDVHDNSDLVGELPPEGDDFGTPPPPPADFGRPSDSDPTSDLDFGN